MSLRSTAATGIILLVASFLCQATLFVTADFGSLAFWSDPACTVSFDPSSLRGINKTFTAWPTLPFTSVAHTVNITNTAFEPPCIANPLPTFPIVSSADYACWNTEPVNNTRGFVTQEYVRPNCDSTVNAIPFQWFVFIGPQSSSCVAGSILVFLQDGSGNVFNGTVDRTVWASFTCSSVSSLSSSSTGSAGANTGGNGSNGSGSVVVSVSGFVGLLCLLVALMFVTAL